MMQKNPKVKFKLANLNKEAERAYEFKETLKQKFELRSGSHFNITLSEELKNKILRANSFEDIKNELINFLKTKKPEFDENKLKEINQAWKEVEKTYFIEVEKITGKKFDFEEYICYLIFSVCGHYEEGSNRIYVDIILSPKAIAAICAEELLHLHYWKIIEDLFKIRMKKFYGKFDMKPWQISEVIPEYILVENPTFFKFKWNNWNRKNSYSWITDLRKILDPIWRNRKDFNDFLIKAHKELNCLP